MHKLNLKGRILAPGTVRLHFNGQPATVHVTKDVLLRAGERAQAKAKAGLIGMRLDHPNVGDLPIRWGVAKDFRVNHETGEVWLSASEPYPEMSRLLGDTAIDRLQEMGLSVHGPTRVKPRSDGSYDLVDLDFNWVDIVDRGAFPGSGITPTIPGEVAAKLAEASRTLPPSLAPAAYEEGVVAARFPPTTGLSEAMPASQEELDMDAKTLQQQNEELQKQLKELEGRLSAKEAEETKTAELGDKLGKLETQVGDLSARAEKAEKRVGELEEEKATRDAADDVKEAIASGKAVPAERDALLKARRKLGREDFKAMISARSVVVPAGERGAAPDTGASGGQPSVEAEAQKDLETHGVEGVLGAGLHELQTPLGEAVRGLLAAKHADHPMVRREMLRGVISAKKPEAPAAGKVS